MCKVYARQINPELQESPLSYSGGGYDVFSVFGNQHYVESLTDVVERVKNTLNGAELSDNLDAIDGNSWHEAYYANYEECIMDYIPAENGKPYDKPQIEKLARLVREYSGDGTTKDLDIMCQVLSIMCEKTYDWTTIRGVCQGDWNYCVFPADENPSTFESEYFNLGSEWMIREADDDEEESDCDNGYTVYVYSWSDEGIRKELAEAAGCKPENVIMYRFAGYIKTPKYELVEL